MNRQLMILNIIFAVGDVLVCMLAIACFGFAAWFFSKWWILPFMFLPLLLYSNHGVIIEADMRQAKCDELKPDGDGDE